MTREQVKEMLPVLQSFADGKTIVTAQHPYRKLLVNKA